MKVKWLMNSLCLKVGIRRNAWVNIKRGESSLASFWLVYSTESKGTSA